MKIRNELDSQTISDFFCVTCPNRFFLWCYPLRISACYGSNCSNVITKTSPKIFFLNPNPTPLVLELLDSLLPSLTALSNSSISPGLSPQVFTSTSIFPLLKKLSLDHNELNNFRQMSNLHVFPKSLKNLLWFKFLIICRLTTCSNSFSQPIDLDILQKRLVWT